MEYYLYFCSINVVKMEDRYTELRRLTEKVMGMEMKTPKDFEQLSMQIYQRTHQLLSVSTLKRFWGYVGKERDSDKTRRTTLNILSEYVGYQDWMHFCQSDLSGDEQSGTMANRHLFPKEQALGSHIVLRWKPDRRVTIRYEGEDLFTVVESIGSKLCPGDTFHCEHIVEGMPLTLFSLIREGRAMGNYVCGTKDGVMFEKG